MEQPSFRSRSKIRREAADLHRDAESCGTEKAPLPSVSPRSTAPRVLPEYPRLDRALRALQGNYLTSAKLLRRAIHPAPELSPPIGHPNDSLSHNIYFCLNAPTNYFTDTTIPKLPPSSISFPPTKTRDRQGHPRLPPSLLTRLLALNLLLPRLILTRTQGHEPPEKEQGHRRRRRPLFRDLLI